jgi:hypothetical protein
MKTMTKTILLLTLLFAYGCAKECDARKDIYYNIAEVDKNMLPYTGFDTITFVRTSVGDTHTFIGMGKTTNYDRTSLSYDCSDYYYRENYSYTFISNTFNSPLYIGQNIPIVSENKAISYINFQNKFYTDYLYLNQSNLDSIIILNKKYYNTQYITKSTSIPANYKIYFNKEYGCLKMILENGETWEILEYKK